MGGGGGGSGGGVITGVSGGTSGGIEDGGGRSLIVDGMLEFLSSVRIYERNGKCGSLALHPHTQHWGQHPAPIDQSVSRI